jgi:hypothetical protein
MVTPFPEGHGEFCAMPEKMKEGGLQRFQSNSHCEKKFVVTTTILEE